MTIISAAGTQASANQLSNAGVDRLVAYHSSAYRRYGLPSVAGLLPWASANQQTLDMLPEVIDGAGKTPVIATVCANDGLIPASEMLRRVSEAGAHGVLNAPTVGLLEGTVRDVLESEGLGRESELALLHGAREASLEGWAYVFDPAWIRSASDAGATGVIIHLGITGYPSPVDLIACLEEARTSGLQQVLLHGGNLTSPSNFNSALRGLPPDLAGAVTGYMGASVFEKSRNAAETVKAWQRAVQFAVDITE